MMTMQWKQRTNERKFKITRSLSPSKRHNKSTVTEEEDKKKRQQVPLSLSNFSLSLFCSACFCVRCIYKITSQNTKRLKTKEIYRTSVCVNVPKFVGVSVSKAQKESKKSKIFEFFRFWLPFLMFFRLFKSLSSQKKENFSFTPVRRKSQSLSFASRASEYIHTHKRPSSWYVLRRRRYKRRRCKCCSFYSFRFCCVHLSLSLFFLA